MRNIAIYQDKVFVATGDARLAALDARTGKLVWDVPITERNKGFTNSSGPIVIRGKVLQGLTGCARFQPDRCYISAYDANSGKQLWRFNTVAQRGERGGDTWGDVADMFRKGGETWITGSYDPDLDLTYWGVAQAKPWVAASRNMKTSDRVLYTSTTVALKPDTGELAVLPACARRVARPGRGLRARARRRGQPEVRVHDRQAWRSCGRSIARAANTSD